MKSTGYERAWDRKVDARGLLVDGAGLAAPRPPRLPARRSAWVYRRAALVHGTNLSALAAVLLLGLIHPSLRGALVVLAAELLFLLLAPRSRWITAHLEAGLAKAEAAEAQAARAALTERMSEAHRTELAQLGLLVEGIDATEARQAPRAPSGDGLDPRELVGSFIRLALAHRACEEALEHGQRGAPQATLRWLEGAHRTSSPQLCSAIAERVEVLRRRTAFEAHLREESAILAHQLATISELIQLRHQQALAAGTCGESAAFAQELAESRAAARELEDLESPAARNPPGALPAAFA